MPSISKHLINRNCTFINQMYPPLVFVVHRTAGHTNVQQLYDYWQSSCISSHFGISYDGYGYDPYDIWQFVNLWDGAGANCCPESGCHPFFDRGGNANVYTISVEVCTPNTNNQGLMTAKQVESLVYLIQTVCSELGIPTDQYSEYWNDYETSHTWIGNNGGIGMHRDVSPHNKRMCPGDPYYQGQMDDIIAQVNSGVTPAPLPIMEDDFMYQSYNLSNIPFSDRAVFSTLELGDTNALFLKSDNGTATVRVARQDMQGNWSVIESFTVTSGNIPHAVGLNGFVAISITLKTVERPETIVSSAIYPHKYG